MLFPACGEEPARPEDAPAAGNPSEFQLPRRLWPWILQRNARQLQGMAGFILTLENDTNFTAVSAGEAPPLPDAKKNPLQGCCAVLRGRHNLHIHAGFIFVLQGSFSP